MEIKLNGKALAAIAMLSSSIVFANFVSIADVKTNGGVTIVEETIIDTTPVGSIILWGTNTPPSGWIKLDGGSTSGYPDLASLYGSNVPDFRGEFVRAWDDGRGVDSGRSVLSYQLDSIKSHNHGIISRDIANPTSAFIINDHSGDSIASADNASDANSEVKMNRYSTELTGGNETRPRNISVMYIVKAE